MRRKFEPLGELRHDGSVGFSFFGRRLHFHFKRVAVLPDDLVVRRGGDDFERQTHWLHGRPGGVRSLVGVTQGGLARRAHPLALLLTCSVHSCWYQ